MRARLTGTLLLLAAMPAHALVGGSIDANTAESAWAGVGAVIVNGTVVSGALIDDRHVLTAAHAVDGASPGAVSFRLNAGNEQTFAASAITVFPGYAGTGSGALGLSYDDLAIIELSAPVAGTVPVYGLYGGSLSDQTLTLVGYGGGGDGINGVTSGANAGVKRVGQNKVDELVPDDDGGPANELFLFDFDGASMDTNVFGDPGNADNLTLGPTIEAQYAGGDSGSPAFVDDNGVWKIAGIGTFILSTNAEPGGANLFGAVGGGTVVAPYADWIGSVTAVPEPEAWLLLLAGLGVIGLRCRTRASSHQPQD
jgi:hypothetical protein